MITVAMRCRGPFFGRRCIRPNGHEGPHERAQFACAEPVSIQMAAGQLIVRLCARGEWHDGVHRATAELDTIQLALEWPA